MKEIKFNDLTVDNVFDFCAVLDKIGLDNILGAFSKDEILAMQSAGDDSKTIGIALAMKMGGILIKHLSGARDEIYNFFARCMVWESGLPVSPEDVRNFKPGYFLKLLKDFFKKDDLSDFFGEVAEFVGVEQEDLKN
ncbi:MAG: hypothetical protein II816_03710 [Elusimicrobia bacterium]|nr:hypothetical protein [Elusimicrobiota bacterium]